MAAETEIQLGCNPHCAAARQLGEVVSRDEEADTIRHTIAEGSAEYTAKCNFIKTGECALVGYMAESTAAMHVYFEEQTEEIGGIANDR